MGHLLHLYLRSQNANFNHLLWLLRQQWSSNRYLLLFLLLYYQLLAPNNYQLPSHHIQLYIFNTYDIPPLIIKELFHSNLLSLIYLFLIIRFILHTVLLPSSGVYIFKTANCFDLVIVLSHSFVIHTYLMHFYIKLQVFQKEILYHLLFLSFSYFITLIVYSLL